MKKLLTSISLCFTMILLITFLLTCTGIIDLHVINEIEFTPLQDFIGCFTMLMINLFFLFSISFRFFDKRIFFMLLGYLPIIFVGNKFVSHQSLFFSTATPVAYILIFTCLKQQKDALKTFVRTVLFLFLVGGYQEISGRIKLYHFGFQFYKCNIATAFIYSIDLYLVYILIYWVVKKHVLASVENPVRWSGFLKSYCQEILAEGAKNCEDVSDLTARQQRVFALLAWLYLTTQSFMVLGLNLLVNKVFHYLGGFYIGAIELIIAWLSLELFRLSLGKSFHSEKPLICNAVSLVVFFILSRFALPLHLSLFFNVSIAALLAYVLHRYVIKKEDYVLLIEEKRKRDEFTNKSRRSRAGLCLQTLSKDHIDYALLSDYANGETLETLADKHNMSFSTVNRKLNALTQK